MSRPNRIHASGGVYYVLQSSERHKPMFADCEDYLSFERLLARALKRTGAFALAYCWTPQAIHLIVRVSETPLGRLMQGVTSAYARKIHVRDGESGHFFGARYKAALIDADAYLLKLIRYVHYAPVLAGLAADLNAYEHTSHAVYVGEREASWVSVRRVRWTSGEASDNPGAYREYMSQPPLTHEIELFRNSLRGDFGVLGGPDFLATLPRRARPYRSKLSLEQIIADVTRALGVDREHVLSSSRRRELALARALIAWLATERRAATLTETAHRLNRDPSTLSVAISRYRMTRPDLFKLNALHFLTPIAFGQARGASESHDVSLEAVGG